MGNDNDNVNDNNMGVKSFPHRRLIELTFIAFMTVSAHIFQRQE